MGIENWPQPVVAPEVKKTRAEKEAVLANANINDADILEKLAEVCGNNSEDFNENELEALRKYAQEGGHQPLEWSSPNTDDKFFIEDDGSIVLGHKAV